MRSATTAVSDFPALDHDEAMGVAEVEYGANGAGLLALGAGLVARNRTEPCQLPATSPPL